MKRSTLFTRIRNRRTEHEEQAAEGTPHTDRRTPLADREFWKYTLFFFAMMVVLYVFLVFAGGLSSPEFTYAEF